MRLGYALILLVGASMLAAPMAGANHGGPLEFSLTADAAPPALGPGLVLMNQAGHSVNGETFVFVENPCQVWVSDDAAVVAVTLSPQNIAWALTFEAPATIASVSVSIGKWAGAFVSAGTQSTDTIPTLGTPPSLTQIYDGTFAYGGDTVLPGDRLAMRVCLTTVKSAGNFLITSDEASVITFQGLTNPPWPTPELATILLTATGLLAVLGVGLVRRRKL